MWRQRGFLKNILKNTWVDLTYSKLSTFNRGQGSVYNPGRFLSSSAGQGQEGPSAGDVEATELKSRALVRLDGPDLFPLLQGLITNDIEHLTTRPAIYSLLLNPQGRVLYDVILYSCPDKPQSSILIECSSALRSKLVGHLKIFRVKRKVGIEPEDRLSLWVIHRSQKEEEPDPLCRSDTKISAEPCCPASLEALEPGSVARSLSFVKSPSVLDPRLQNLGWRVLLPRGEAIEQGIKVRVDEERYQRLRYCLGVGEGPAELPPGGCFPLESNGDYLHGISFQKGCYVGQELTARTYHTGVIRKRLMSFRLEDGVPGEVIKFDSEIVNAAGKSVGKVRGSAQKSRSGIALVRVEEVVGKGPLKLKLNGDASASVTISRPFWWPAVASTSAITSGSSSKESSK